MEEFLKGLPPNFQVAAMIGIAMASAVLWYVGKSMKGKGSSEMTQEAKDAVAKVAALQAKLDLQDVQSDFAEVISATRKSFYEEIEKLRDVLSDISLRLAQIEGMMRRDKE